MQSGPQAIFMGPGDLSEGHDDSFGEGPRPSAASTLFGTQHIRTGIGFVRGNRFAGDRARFLDPSSRDTHWVGFAHKGYVGSHFIGITWTLLASVHNLSPLYSGGGASSTMDRKGIQEASVL
jgi:hypothetical protein